MDLKEQIILEYLEQGCGYRKLQAKYGIGRTTIWVQILKLTGMLDVIGNANGRVNIIRKDYLL